MEAEANVEDAFHLHSRPIHDPSLERGKIYAQAYEATLDFDGGVGSSNLTRNNLISWKGKDIKGKHIEIMTDRCDRTAYSLGSQPF